MVEVCWCSWYWDRGRSSSNRASAEALCGLRCTKFYTRSRVGCQNTPQTISCLVVCKQNHNDKRFFSFFSLSASADHISSVFFCIFSPNRNTEHRNQALQGWFPAAKRMPKLGCRCPVCWRPAAAGCSTAPWRCRRSWYTWTRTRRRRRRNICGNDILELGSWCQWKLGPMFLGCWKQHFRNIWMLMDVRFPKISWHRVWFISIHIWYLKIFATPAQENFSHRVLQKDAAKRAALQALQSPNLRAIYGATQLMNILDERTEDLEAGKVVQDCQGPI